MCWRRQVAVAAVLLLACVPVARADSLADAEKAVEASDYLTAQPALEAALKDGKAGPGDLAEIYKLTGIVEAALGNEKPAQTAFEKWLSLDPKGALPQGTSPKITRPFASAQANAKLDGPLHAKAETADEPPAVTLVIANDPHKLIVGAKVYFRVDRGKAEQVLEAEGKDRITIDLALGKRIDLRVQAVDQYGNRVVELGSKDVPIVITSSGQEKQIIDAKDKDLLRVTKDKPSYDQPRPFYLQWWLWGTVTVLATGVTGYYAWQTRSDIQEIDHLNANSLAHPWSDAQTVQDSAKRNLLVTNIAGGTAGVFAIGTILLYVTRPRNFESDARTTTITPVPQRGGGALVIGGHF